MLWNLYMQWVLYNFKTVHMQISNFGAWEIQKTRTYNIAKWLQPSDASCIFHLNLFIYSNKLKEYLQN